MPLAGALHAPAAQSRSFRAILAAHWQRPLLVAILALSSALNFIGLTGEGYANTYYAAAVKSMLTSWHNFFFVAFDAGGFVSVDKPPLGLWLQTISAKFFGFSGLSLLLPQALAGVASVALLYWLVRRAWGPAAGLVAALALAVTPISAVTSRNNTSDTVLVLASLGAAWGSSRAAERGSLRWLLLAGVFVGLGFNVKMLEAYLAIPGLVLAYLLGAPRSWRARVGHLAAFGFVTLLVSLSWMVAVDLTPASARPYVGSSGTNSALSLALGYNGLSRLTLAFPAGVRESLTFLPGNLDLDVAPAFAPGIGDPGLLRLFNAGLAGQASWPLPLAVIGLVAGAFAVRCRLPLDPRGQSLLLWGGWLLGTAGFFSVARFFHLYYLTILGPGIAALVGIGVAALWRAWRRGGVWTLALPLALVATAFVQSRILASYPQWSARLTTPLLIICIGAAAALLLARIRLRCGRLVGPSLVALALLTLLAAPTTWAAISVQGGNGGAWLPEAGPANSMSGSRGGNFALGGQAGGFPPGGGVQQRGNTPRPNGNAGQQGAASTFPDVVGGNRGGGGNGQAMTFAGAQWNNLDPRLVQYLVANQGSATFLVATPTSSYASVFMLATDQPALALGGYQGWDRILTPEQLAALVRAGTVRFFYLNGAGSTASFGGATTTTPSGANINVASLDATADLSVWVRSSCTVVPTATWQGVGTAAATTPGTQGQQLYDCSAVAAR
ncbi:MAG TPA: glycosyltransferase family 39 protein [Thermomicrobiales bacterium]